MPLVLSIILIFIVTVIIVSILEDFGFGVLIGMLVTFFAFLLIIVISMIPESKEVLYEETKISALKDNSNMSGSFFLGSGTIDEETYYYYVKESNRGKSVEKIPTDDAYLNEGSYEPHIKVYRHEYTGKFARWYFGTEAWGGYVYEIYIPEGSVTTEFSVDLE